MLFEWKRWFVTKDYMSQKMNFHTQWKVTEYEMLQKIKCHKYLIQRNIKMSKKLYAINDEILRTNKTYQNYNCHKRRRVKKMKVQTYKM